MRSSTVLLLGAAAALGVRVVRSRHRRFLHPAGVSGTGELEIWGAPRRTGSVLLDTPARHPVTVRISKGGGTPGAWPDVLGLAVRVPGADPGAPLDLLLSTAGRGRLTRHLPAPRRGFDTRYGSILAYRTGGPPVGTVYLTAVVDPDGAALGDTLDQVAAAVSGGRCRLLLCVDGEPGPVPVGRITLRTLLPARQDAALAFDPVRHTTRDLHPTGLVHASRAWAYRCGQRWRGATPAAPDPAAVRRTAAHR